MWRFSTFDFYFRFTKLLVDCTECRVFCESGILCNLCRRMGRTGVSESTILFRENLSLFRGFPPFSENY